MTSIWWVVEYMDGTIRQTLIFAESAKAAQVGFTGVLRVVPLH